MKKLFVFLIAMCTFFISCKRYEDGPLISFRTAKNRIIGFHSISRYTVDGTDSLSLYNTKLGPNFWFYTKEEENNNYLIIYTISATDYDSTALCFHWQLIQDNTFISLTPCGYKQIGIAPLRFDITSHWQILRLTKKDFHLKSTYNSKEYLLELKSID